MSEPNNNDDLLPAMKILHNWILSTGRWNQTMSEPELCDIFKNLHATDIHSHIKNPDYADRILELTDSQIDSLVKQIKKS